MASTNVGESKKIAHISDKNALNLIRLLAAFQVLFGHAEAHLKVDFFPDFLNVAFSILQGVPVFFILSGFLIWNSIGKTPDLVTFCKKRVFRLYPELWCGVAINFIVVTVLFIKQIRWFPYLIFQVAQSTFLQFWTPDFLRAYGCGVPNGSLWTISVMLQAYLVLWFFYKLLHGKSIVFWVIANACCVALSFTPKLLVPILPEFFIKLYGQTFVPYLFLFVIGMTLCEYFSRIIDFLKEFWLVFVIVVLGVVYFGLDIVTSYGILKSILIAPAIIGFAYRFPQLAVRKDFSYGIYIYHMIVINILVHFGFVGQFWAILVVALLSLLLAMLSYYTVGAFSRKKRETLM